MAITFKNPLTSLAGIKERLTNVKDVLLTSLNPFSSTKIEASSKLGVAKPIAEFVANNPFTTAGLAVAATSTAVKGAVTKAIASTTLKTKVVASAAALVATPALISSPKTVSAAGKVVSGLTPESLVKFGANVGKTVETPSLANIKNVFTESPIIAGTIATVAAVAGIKAISTAGLAISNIVATKANTKALADSTEQIQTQMQSISNNAPTVTIPSNVQTGKIPDTNPVPINPSPSPLVATGSVKSPTKTKRKRRVCTRRAKSINTANVKMNINVKSTRCGANIC